MEAVIFENGLAKADGVVTAYNVNPENGLFVSQVQEAVTKGVGLPAFCTIEAPPLISEGESKIARLTGDGWEVVDDLRGQTAYEKSSGKAVIISAIGPLDSSLTLLAPATAHDSWLESSWVTDTVAQKAAQVKEAEATRAAKLAEVNSVTQVWQTQLALGMISEANKVKLINWMTYADQLSALDTSLAPYVVWPDKPAV